MSRNKREGRYVGRTGGVSYRVGIACVEATVCGRNARWFRNVRKNLTILAGMRAINKSIRSQNV